MKIMNAEMEAGRMKNPSIKCLNRSHNDGKMHTEMEAGHIKSTFAVA